MQWLEMASCRDGHASDNRNAAVHANERFIDFLNNSDKLGVSAKIQKC